MDYKKLIDETRNKIENYSFDDDIYKGIYDAAKEKLDSAYKEGLNTVDSEHKTNRRKAIADNAVQTKSLREELAARGLARSGESAALSLNQSMALRNTVTELAREALKSKSELRASHAKELAALEQERSDKTVAAAEKEKEALADRLKHLESLDADKERWQADYNMELIKETNRAKEAAAKLEAENTKAEKAETEEKKDLPTTGHTSVTPKTPAEDVAKSLMKLAHVGEGERIYSEYAQTQIRHQLARLVVTSGLSKEYTNEVLLQLKMYGFDGDFDVEFATGKTFKWIYAAWKNAYDEKYRAQAYLGSTHTVCDNAASVYARQAVREYIAKLHLTDYEKLQLSKLYWMQD